MYEETHKFPIKVRGGMFCTFLLKNQKEYEDKWFSPISSLPYLLHGQN